jgi:hypothetical protein
MCNHVNAWKYISDEGVGDQGERKQRQHHRHYTHQPIDVLVHTPLLLIPLGYSFAGIHQMISEAHNPIPPHHSRFSIRLSSSLHGCTHFPHSHLFKFRCALPTLCRMCYRYVPFPVSCTSVQIHQCNLHTSNPSIRKYRFHSLSSSMVGGMTRYLDLLCTYILLIFARSPSRIRSIPLTSSHKSLDGFTTLLELPTWH